ncbi:MAG: hypothetical protein ACQEWV_26685 [Bacillota bacterium]
MNINTCSYCGSSLGTSPIASNDKCYCGFCEMFVDPSVNGERLDRFKKEEFVGYEHMNKTTSGRKKLNFLSISLIFQKSK